MWITFDNFPRKSETPDFLRQKREESGVFLFLRFLWRGFLIHCGNIVYKVPHSFYNLWRLQYFDPPPEAADPGIKHVADLHFCLDSEVRFVYFFIFHANRSELVHHSIQPQVQKANGDFPTIDNQAFGVQLLGLFPATKAADGAAQVPGLTFRKKTGAVDTFGQQAQFIKFIGPLGDKVAALWRIFLWASW